MIRAVVGSKKADEQVVVALGGDGKGEGLGQSLAEIQASRPGQLLTFKRSRSALESPTARGWVRVTECRRHPLAAMLVC